MTGICILITENRLPITDMHYLIDGHNLIAQLDDISLSDPDDEVKLILKLRRWTAARKKRKVTVYFDGGIPGGKNVNLSNAQVKVIFASAGRTADSLIIRRINKVSNPPEYKLISSDQQIIAAAKARKMKYWRSQTFARQLDKQIEARKRPSEPEPDDPDISEQEVEEWLQLFGPVDEDAIQAQIAENRRRRQKKTHTEPEPEPEPEETVPPLPTPVDRENPELSDAELEEWLALFGGEVKKPTDKETTKKRPVSSKKKRKPKLKRKNPYNLDEDDLDAWEAFLNQKE